MGSLSSLLVCMLIIIYGSEIMSSMGSNLQKGHMMIMEEEELLGLFEVMGALLEDPDWAQAHPQPCTETPWPGVECEFISNSDDPHQIFHVTKIHIGPDIVSPPCKSSAYLSEALLKLKYVKTLSIFNCFVSSSQVTLPKTLFGSFSSLEHLALESNPSLYGEIPSSLGDVPNLRVLTLSQNSLQGNIPSQIGGLVCLKQLDLSYNNLSGQIPKEIGGLKSLTILDLSGNVIEGTLPYSLGNLQLLQKIDLHSNRITGSIPPDLGRLKSLVLLDLSHNLIVGPIPETMSSLELLEYLVIDDNPIKGGIPLFIRKLRRLKSVSLSGCELTGPILPNSFSSLKNLTTLSLDNNSLSGTVPTMLGSLPNLDQLNISYNRLSGVLKLPEDFIRKLGKRLDVRGNKVCLSDPPNMMKNLSTSYLEIPSCLTSTRTRRSNNISFGDGRPLEDPSSGMKPSWYESSNTSSSCASWQDELRVIIITFVLTLVICFFNF